MIGARKPGPFQPRRRVGPARRAIARAPGGDRPVVARRPVDRDGHSLGALVHRDDDGGVSGRGHAHEDEEKSAEPERQQSRQGHCNVQCDLFQLVRFDSGEIGSGARSTHCRTLSARAGLSYIRPNARTVSMRIIPAQPRTVARQCRPGYRDTVRGILSCSGPSPSLLPAWLYDKRARSPRPCEV